MPIPRLCPAAFSAALNFGKNVFLTNKDKISGNVEVQIYEFGDFQCVENHWFLSVMNTYGSIRLILRQNEAQDHFLDSSESFLDSFRPKTTAPKKPYAIV